MKINVTYAASVANAPAGYKAAVQAAVAIYEALIQDPITVNITFGYGDIAGQPVPSSAIGVSTSDHGYVLNYTELRSALGEAATSVQDVAAAMALTPYDMTDGGVFYIPSAQAKALGIVDGASTRNDGFVGLSSAQPMNYSTTQRAVSGQYDAVGIFLHEIGHVLGRISYQGEDESDGSTFYAALDLYRGSGGAHDPVNGRSLLSGLTFPIYGTLNDPSNGGSSSDWGPSMFGDAYNAFGSPGVKSDISTSGQQLLDVLGYDVRARPAPVAVQPSGSMSSAAVTIPANSVYTVSFSPSLYIKDAASPASGYLRLNAASGQPNPVLSIGGQAVLEASTGDLNGIVATGAGTSASIVFTSGNGGSLWVRALNGDARGLLALGPVDASSGISNTQVVSDRGEATGFEAQGAGSLTVAIGGTLKVFGVGQAVGVANASVSNNGMITAVVTAAQGAQADAFGVLDPVSFRNTGSIEARTLVAGDSVGIEVKGANLAGLSSHTLTYTNSGTITGEYSFRENPSAPLPTDFKVRIENSNAMIGDIVVGSVASEIVNTGVIAGDIWFGDGDNSYDGTNGLFIGDLMLGDGMSRLRLGNDGESVIAGAGSVDLVGGAGVDTLSYVQSNVGVRIDLRVTTAQTVFSNKQLTVRGVENLTGGAGADQLTGDAAANRLYDYGGGNDVLSGGGGNDLLWVERYTATPSTAVTLDGGDGDDRLVAHGVASATILGGAGADRVTVDMTGGAYQISLGPGADTLFFASVGAITSSIVVTDFGADDRLDLTALLDDALTNYTDGANPFASGHLRLVQSGSSTLLQVDANGGGDSYTTLATLWNFSAGGLFPSDLGGFLSNIYSGALLPGTADADVLSVQPGRNALQGLAGDDTLNGGTGSDFLDGGAGIDTAVYRAPLRAYALSLDGQGGGKVAGGPEGGVDGLTSVERLKFVDGYLSISTADTAAQVYRIYVAALGREPDAPGLASWVKALQGGAALSAVAAGFLGSPEFGARFGASTSSDSQFITLLYANVLHRTPDASGMNTWTSYLASGHSRAEAVIGFSESGENIRNTAGSIQQGTWVGDPNAGVAARLYDTVFGRLPDAAGLADWTRALNGGTSLSQVAAGFVSAPEFRSTYGALSDAAFVNLLYQNVLHRQADQPGLATWTGALAQGQSRADVVIGFSESAEHIRLTAPQIDNGVWFA